MVKHKNLTGVIIFCIGLGISLPSYADRYKRVVPFVDDRNVPIPLPKNKTVCQSFLKLLNYHATKNTPLSCERPIPQGWTNFTKPEWKEIPLKENEDLLKKIDHFYRSDQSFWTTYKKDFNEEKWLESIRVLLSSQTAHLYQTKIDLNSDGQPETIIKYIIEPFCDSRRGEPEMYPAGLSGVWVIDKTNPLEVWFLGVQDIIFYQNEIFESSIDWYGNIYIEEKAIESFVRVCKFSFSKSK